MSNIQFDYGDKIQEKTVKSEKKIKEAKANIAAKNEIIEKAQEELNERKKDLKHKKGELDDIIKDTEKEENL